MWGGAKTNAYRGVASALVLILYDNFKKFLNRKGTHWLFIIKFAYIIKKI